MTEINLINSLSATPYLTIAIPSYNRNQRLHYTLTQLLPQLTDRCELLILDNCSEVPISESSRHLLSSKTATQVRVVRHRTNVGGNENILRCLENATGAYVWLLGDDDSPSSNAIDSILSEIARYPDAVLFNMHAAIPGHKNRRESTVTEGAAAYLESCSGMGELIFISSLVFKVSAVIPHLGQAYFMQYTCAPQLVAAIKMLGENGQAIVSNVSVIREDSESTPPSLLASSIPIAVGFSVLPMLALGREIDQLLDKVLCRTIRTWITPLGVLNQLVTLTISGSYDQVCYARTCHRFLRKNLFRIRRHMPASVIIFHVGFVLLRFPRLGFYCKQVIHYLYPNIDKGERPSNRIY